LLSADNQFQAVASSFKLLASFSFDSAASIGCISSGSLTSICSTGLDPDWHHSNIFLPVSIDGTNSGLSANKPVLSFDALTKCASLTNSKLAVNSYSNPSLVTSFVPTFLTSKRPL